MVLSMNPENLTWRSNILKYLESKIKNKPFLSFASPDLYSDLLTIVVRGGLESGMSHLFQNVTELCTNGDKTGLNNGKDLLCLDLGPNSNLKEVNFNF
jgi:hypothetical protein